MEDRNILQFHPSAAPSLLPSCAGVPSWPLRGTLQRRAQREERARQLPSAGWQAGCTAAARQAGWGGSPAGKDARQGKASTNCVQSKMPKALPRAALCHCARLLLCPLSPCHWPCASTRLHRARLEQPACLAHRTAPRAWPLTASRWGSSMYVASARSTCERRQRPSSSPSASPPLPPRPSRWGRP